MELESVKNDFLLCTNKKERNKGENDLHLSRGFSPSLGSWVSLFGSWVRCLCSWVLLLGFVARFAGCQLGLPLGLLFANWVCRSWLRASCDFYFDPCLCFCCLFNCCGFFFFFLEGLSWIFLEGEKRKKKKKGISAFWFSFVELECLKLEFQANFHWNWACDTRFATVISTL